MVIVIDPGHGGENEGTVEHLKGIIEKDMTLETAGHLYDELSQYEGVELYMTRESDRDLELKERAEFAKSVSADFLFSIHYNASVNHDLYGAEVWIPSEMPYMKQGFDFAIPMLHLFDEEGIFIRGAKTRLNIRGSNYYGIIRESTRLGIPCVIIEHCHVDHKKDVDFCDSSEDYRNMALLDARAIAGYLGLKKEDGTTPEINTFYASDETTAFIKNADPEYCRIERESATDDSVLIHVSAKDAGTILMYYDYSVDGGMSFTDRIPVPGYDYFGQKCDEEFTCSVERTPGQEAHIIFRVHNFFDRIAVSNCIDVEAPPEKEEPEELPAEPVEEEILIVETEEDAEPERERKSEGIFLIIICAAFFMAFIATVFLIKAMKDLRGGRRED